jgi:hypothetical protein
MVHEPERSDLFTVAGKPANNSEESEAELVERREGAEGSTIKELVVVALGLSPVTMNRGNERLGILHAERVDLRPVLFFQACISKTPRRVVLLGMVAVAEFECTPEDADGVVAAAGPVGWIALALRWHLLRTRSRQSSPSFARSTVD